MGRRSFATVLASGLACASVFAASSACADDAPPAPAATAPEKPVPPKPDPADVKPARPPALVVTQPASMPWGHHIEFGPDLAFVSQPVSHDNDGAASAVRLESSFGFGIHATFALSRFVQMGTYFVDSNHSIHFGPNSLGLPGSILSESLHTYALGLRIQPMLPIGKLARAWVSGGIGWGRWDFPRMEVEENGASCAQNTYNSKCYMLYERANSMAQFPFGAGASIEIIPRWLALTVEFSVAVPEWQSGTAVDATRAVDNGGHNRAIGGLPLDDASIVETLGLSLVL